MNGLRTETRTSLLKETGFQRHVFSVKRSQFGPRILLRVQTRIRERGDGHYILLLYRDRWRDCVPLTFCDFDLVGGTEVKD